MKFHVLFVTALLLPLVPTASAAACPPGNEAITAISHPASGQLLFYVSAEPGLYEESNGFAGLQTRGGSCEDSEGRPVEYLADAKTA